MPLLCGYDAHLIVRDDKLTAVAARKNSLDKTSPLIALELANWDSVYGCSYSKLVVAAMFDQVEQILNINIWDASLEVRFDSKYGYVSDYDVRYGYRTGGVSECCIWFKFRNFQHVSK